MTTKQEYRKNRSSRNHSSNDRSHNNHRNFSRSRSRSRETIHDRRKKDINKYKREYERSISHSKSNDRFSDESNDKKRYRSRRHKSRHKNRNKYRHSRSRDRSRSRTRDSRDRSRTRDSRDRSRARDSRDRSRTRESRDRSRDRTDSKARKNRRRRKHRNRKKFSKRTSIAIVHGIPSDCTEMDLQSAISSYHATSICIVHNHRNPGLPSSKHALIRFDNVNRCVAFVEDNEFFSGEFLFHSNISLTLDYASTSANANFVPTMKCDWLCSKCYYYNLSKNSRCSRTDCRALFSAECTRISSKGHPFMPGKIIVDRKGEYIDFLSSAVLVVEGIGSNTTAESVAYAFSLYAHNLQAVYIVNQSNFKDIKDESGVLMGSIAFVQFLTSNDAKHALKQALLNNVTVENLPVHLAFVQSNALELESVKTADVKSEFYQNLENQAMWARSTSSSTVYVNENPINQISVAAMKAGDFGIADTFVWDSLTSFFYDATSGYYYDIHRRLYYYQGLWYAYDTQKKLYIEVKDPLTIGKIGKNDGKHETPQKSDVDNMAPVKFEFKGKIKTESKAIVIKEKIDQKEIKIENKENEKTVSLTAEQTMMIASLPYAQRQRVLHFCNVSHLCCYLCSRQFQSMIGLQEHVRLSPLHLAKLMLWVYEQKQNVVQKKNKINDSDGDSLQSDFMQIMADYNSSRCDKKADGGTRALMK